MPQVTTAEYIEAALGAWPYHVESVTPTAGHGMNSTTFLIAIGGGQYVAKLVDDIDAPGFVRSMQIAEFLATRGLRSGPPVRTRDGELTITLPEGGVLALLQHEPGVHPDMSEPRQVRRAGRALARAHGALRDYPVESDPHYRWPWEWVDRLLDTIAMPDHVNAAARRIWPEIVRTASDHQLTIGIIHADPEFLLADDPNDTSHPDQTTQDAVIDWATALRGPLLYDLACIAVMTKHKGPQVARWFAEGYAAQMPGIRPQLAHLDWLIKARWMANAIYFADRIERGIERGSTSQTFNEDGLAEAYAAMTASA